MDMDRAGVNRKMLAVALSAALLGGLGTMQAAQAADGGAAASTAATDAASVWRFPGVRIVDAASEAARTPQVAPAFGEVVHGDLARVVAAPDASGAQDKPAYKRAADSISFIVPEDGQSARLLKTFEAIDRVVGKAGSDAEIKATAEAAGVPGMVLNERRVSLSHRMAATPFRPPTAVLPHGVLKNGGWTEGSRFYPLEDGRFVEFIERDLRATNEVALLSADMINADFNGHPGIGIVSTDDKGRTVQRAFWVWGPKAYEIIVVDPRPEAAAWITAESREADAGAPENAPVGHSVVVLGRSFKPF